MARPKTKKITPVNESDDDRTRKMIQLFRKHLTDSESTETIKLLSDYQLRNAAGAAYGKFLCRGMRFEVESIKVAKSCVSLSQLEYKCQRCSKVFAYGQRSPTDNAKSYGESLYHDAFRHSCEDGGFGLVKHIGCSSPIEHPCVTITYCGEGVTTHYYFLTDIDDPEGYLE